MIYALAVLSTIAATLFRPAHSALLPSLCHTGHELASANVCAGSSTPRPPSSVRCSRRCCSTRRCLGVFSVAAAAVVVGGALLLRLEYDAPPRPSRPLRPGLVREAGEGLRAVVAATGTWR